jgi:hypothetical protein
MYNKNEITKSIDLHIEKNKATLSTEEIEFLLEIREKIIKSKNEKQLLKWGFELLRFINLFRDLFSD